MRAWGRMHNFITLKTLYGFKGQQNKEEERPMIDERKLVGTMDKSPEEQQIRKSTAVILIV